MTPAGFRRIALVLPEVIEGAHMGHADFRVRGRVFATLGWPDKGWGMVKLTPELQDTVVSAEPKMFEPVNGAWGRQGSTKVRLAEIDEKTLTSALTSAWQQVVSKHPATKPRGKQR